MRCVFAGTPVFALPALRALAGSPHDVLAVFTQPDRPAGRGRRSRASPVKQLAIDLGLPVHQPRLLSPDSLRILATLNADIMIVAAYGLILPQAVLDLPRLGCINIHASLLPRWRGAAPIPRAIQAGDEQTGITIMQISAGLDTGDILLRRATPIGDNDTAASVHDRLALLGAEALLDALTGLIQGDLMPEPQDDTRASYALKLSKAEAELEWTQSAEQLSRQVRALFPWPVAQTRYRGAPLRVWQATPIVATAHAQPGSVIAATPWGIDVATGKDVLRLVELQMPGARAISAAEFINAQKLDGIKFPC